MKITNKLMLLAALFAALVATPSQAQDVAEGGDDESAVVAIKKKYFLKAKRFEFGVNGSVLPNDAFLTGFGLGGSLGYHFTESFFIEAPGAMIFNVERDSTDFLRNNLGVTPDLDDIKYYGELHLGWSPIYGKLSFMSKKIFYFDLSLYGGGGMTGSEVSDMSPHAVFGIAQRFVINKWMAFRIDAKDAINFRDDAGVSSSVRNIVYIMLGLNFFLPLR